MVIALQRPVNRVKLSVPPAGRTDMVIVAKAVELSQFGLQLLANFEQWAWQHATTRDAVIRAQGGSGTVGENEFEQAWFGEV